MFQRSRKGYVEQQIEMLAEVLSRILTGKESGRYAAALTEAADACKKMTGLNLATLTGLPDETLLNLFRMGGGLDPARCVLAARLPAAQADVYEAQRRTVAAQASLHKALVLLLEPMRFEKSLRTAQYREQVEDILVRLNGYHLPDDLLSRIAGYRTTAASEAL
ncbi:MAG: hypothetical protein M3Y22_06905 [Pseudomonadota bacterium]|nr:hypothetical protein [Pseudomonadota bacterium]